MSARALLRPALRAARGPAQARTLFSNAKTPHRATDNLNIRRLADSRSTYDRDRTAFLVAGALAGAVGIVYTSLKLKEAIGKKGKEEKRTAAVTRLDSGVPTETFTVDGGTRRKVVVHDAEGNEVVPTGNGTVPTFPRRIDLSTGGKADASPPAGGDGVDTEYTLVGLGVRTVSFLSIKVYVVGFYVATADIAALQSYLVKRVNALATTLVAGEREELRRDLLDPEGGEEVWDKLLREAGCRTVFRIVPVRDTDFHHLRDAFVRAIQARSTLPAKRDEYGDDGFGDAVAEFRGLMNRGKVARKDELLLCRDGRGALSLVHEQREEKEGGGEGEGKGKRVEIGRVEDERLSRLLWLNYLAGKKVASDGARESIIDGVMEFVERPIGTVATQVV